MASVVREEKSKRSKTNDSLLLLGAGLFVAVVPTAAFWLADVYHVSEVWLFALVGAAGFFVAVGWGYRSKFRSPAVVVFLAVWMLLHVAIYLLVLSYLGFLYYLPIMVLELWVGYAVAIWRFGPPPDQALR
ncbi:MAG: hypothetical protein HY046_04640 [Acidobacteria bacterium]|nr:hypothetical protein [Acidobacteriota bacterium]